jgi:hypothetical protein
MTDYQVFDSMNHLYDSMRFSVPGFFFLWDGVEPSAMEKWAQEQGYLLKLHYQRSWNAPARFAEIKAGTPSFRIRCKLGAKIWTKYCRNQVLNWRRGVVALK